jgi:hypothetical protein
LGLVGKLDSLADQAAGIFIHCTNDFSVLIMAETMAEELQLRIHGDVSLPTLIYLPGLQGNQNADGCFLAIQHATQNQMLRWRLSRLSP